MNKSENLNRGDHESWLNRMSAEEVIAEGVFRVS